MQTIMDFFISSAHAQGAQQGGGTSLFVMMFIMFGAFYFLLIRPQQKKQKAHAALVAAISKGDEVVTAGGMLGKVTAVSDLYVTLEIADNVEIKIQKSTIQAVAPKGTFDQA